MNTGRKKYCHIFAHRGARKEAADNTRLAFDKALTYPIDGIETDVQLTLDEVSVLWHDRFLDKLGFADKHIDDYTFEQLKQFNFAGYFSDTETEGVLTLREFVERYRAQCKLQIEIKNREWEDVQRHQIKIQQCLEILVSSNELDVFISSFNLPCLQYAHQLGTTIPLVYAFRDIDTLSKVKKAFTSNHFLAGICYPINSLNAELADYMSAQNKLIVTYTCKTQQEIQKALDLEVDVLISDDPAKALQMRG